MEPFNHYFKKQIHNHGDRTRYSFGKSVKIMNVNSSKYGLFSAKYKVALGWNESLEQHPKGST